MKVWLQIVLVTVGVIALTYGWIWITVHAVPPWVWTAAR